MITTAGIKVKLCSIRFGVCSRLLGAGSNRHPRRDRQEDRCRPWRNCPLACHVPPPQISAIAQEIPSACWPIVNVSVIGRHRNREAELTDFRRPNVHGQWAGRWQIADREGWLTRVGRRVRRRTPNPQRRGVDGRWRVDEAYDHDLAAGAGRAGPGQLLNPGQGGASH